MPSGPTTSLDLTDPGFVADPYPRLAAELSAAPVAWSESAGMWLVFGHAECSAALRHRGLQRIWTDREPAAALEPFNLLHRNQMMENPPPVHTRLRRPVAEAFNRGHVERLRPVVRELAAYLLGRVSSGEEFDVIAEYAEPLPVLVIARLLGVEEDHVDDLRGWSQAIVAMYEPAPGPDTVDAAVRASTEFAALVADLIARRRRTPAADLISDLVATDLSDDEVIATVVLLLNAGHEASVNVFGNGLRPLLDLGRPGLLFGGEVDAATAVEEMLRWDSALQMFVRTAVGDLELAGVPVAAGEQVALLLGSANRDPGAFAAPTAFDPTRDPNPHLAFSAGVHFCLGAPLARMELTESLTALLEGFGSLKVVDAESRGTFVLRGHRRLVVSASPDARGDDLV